MASLKYWLWLTTLKGLPARKVLTVLEHFGSPEHAYFADPPEYELIPDLTAAARAALRDKSFDEAERVLERCDRLGVRMVTRNDAAYPARLKELDDPPALLYFKGKELPFDDEPVITVVGTRKATPYGIAMAGKFGEELARHGALVVSGAAEGIDSAALRGALLGGGTVAAVLGGGVDVIYPRFNAALYQDVAAAGTLISEYPPGTETIGAHFPVRNRIMSGLSVGVLAVEACRPSGTLITTRLAGEQNRDVFAVPGPVGVATSEGTNWLIQSNQAKLVTRGYDVMEEYLYRFPGKILQPDTLPADVLAARASLAAAGAAAPETRAMLEKEVDKPPERAYIDWKVYKDRLTDDQRDILVALADKSLNADQLIEQVQIPARRVSGALTVLEMEGMVSKEPGGRFSAAVLLRFEQ